MRDFIIYVNENADADENTDKTWRTYEGSAETPEELVKEVKELEEYLSTDTIGKVIDITDRENHFEV